MRPDSRAARRSEARIATRQPSPETLHSASAGGDARATGSRRESILERAAEIGTGFGMPLRATAPRAPKSTADSAAATTEGAHSTSPDTAAHMSLAASVTPSLPSIVNPAYSPEPPSTAP